MIDEKQKKFIVALVVIVAIWGGVVVIELYARYGNVSLQPTEVPTIHPPSRTTDSSLTEADLWSKPVEPKFFDPAGVVSITKNRVGDVIRGMRIVSIGPVSARISNVNLENLHIVFSGKVTLAGTYQIVTGFNFEEVWFGVTGEEREKLPRLVEDDTGDRESLCFPFSDIAKKYFGSLGDSGKATIEIDTFDITRYPAEAVCNDKFVRVISVEKDK